MDGTDSIEARQYRRRNSQTSPQTPRSPENGSRAVRHPTNNSHPEDRRRSVSTSAPSTAVPSRSYVTPQTNGLYTIPSEPSTSGNSDHKVTEQQRQKPPMPRSSTSSNLNLSQPKPSNSSSRNHPIMEMHSQSLQGAAELIAAQQRTERPRSSSVSSSPSSSPSSSKGKKFALSKMLGSGSGALISPAPPSPGGRARGQVTNGISVPKGGNNDILTSSPKRYKPPPIPKPSKPPNSSSVEIGPPVLDKGDIKNECIESAKISS